MKKSFRLKDVCMAIVLYNGDCGIVDEILELSESLGKTVLIDNSSTRAEFLKELEDNDNVQIIYNGRNQGIAYALNQGLEYASENKLPLLLTMDQDSRINIDTICKLVESISLKDRVVSVGPYYDGQYHGEDRAVNCLITSGNLVVVEAIKRVGGYTSELFIDCVDIDLSFNLKKNGYVLKQIADTAMSHKIGEYEVSKLTGKRYLSHSPLRFFYKTRNNLFIQEQYFKHIPFICLKLGVAFVGEMIKLLIIENNKSEKLKYVKEGFKQGIHINNWENLT